MVDPVAMSWHAIHHFESVLGPRNIRYNLLYTPPTWFQSLSVYRVSTIIGETMIKPPSPEEIKKHFFKMNPNKAPGPDGLTSGFFRASWEIIGQEVVDSITHFFSSGFLPSSANATILSLVPKSTVASLITDYRPISCLNTIYKVISRILVSRLQPMLPDFIVPNQTAFVKDRLLVKNTVLASELVNGYHKRGGVKRITIKVDIAKAFDTLSWDFLFHCLEGLQVPPYFLQRLRASVCTTSFMVGYNGTVNGYFKGTRGLRQGDPLSPYLYVIAMNCLSLLLKEAATAGTLGYHDRCNTSKLTHLCFADDLLIFIDGSVSSVQRVLQVLHEFEKRSGLKVSLQKTSFFSSGLTDAEIDTIQASTGMIHDVLPVRYLGVPLCTTKLNLLHCERLIQQVKSRFNSWTVKTLSFAGRLLLIKTVIAGITNFWCSSFVLPKACINKINSLCSMFLWKGNIEGRNTARVSWEIVTRRKEHGGLGITDLVTWNKATCLKLIWMLFFKAGSVWVAWFRDEVLNGDISNYWTIQPSRKHSWLANKLLKLRSEVYPWIKLRVRDGRTCKFWVENWSPFGNLQVFLNPHGNSRLGIAKTATLASLCRNGVWRLPNARSDNQLQFLTFLTTFQLQDGDDYYEWELQGRISNRYSTGEVYRLLRGDQPVVPWKDIVWSSGSIPRHSFLTWLFILDRCPTRDRILSWGLQTDPTCLLCSTEPESRNHLLFNCCFSLSILTALSRRCSLQALPDWDQTILQLTSLRTGKLHRRLVIIAWQATIYAIWTERNYRLHRSVFRSTDSITKNIITQVTNRISSFRPSNPAISSKLMQIWFSTE